MRLRNLYEVQINPGDRKGFSLRLKKLEDLQLQVAEMQSTIANLKGTSVPDVLKTQMQNLIDAANLEKEKLYAGYETASPRQSVEGIPGNLLQLFKAFDKNASTIMAAYRRTGKFLYRGIKSDDDSLYGKPFDERRAKDSNSLLSNLLNKALADQGFDARRDNTSFTSASKGQASNYGTVYVIVPRDGFTFHYSKNIADLVLDAGKLNLLVDADLVKKITSIIKTNWENVKQYFSHKYEDDRFFTSYDYEQDIRSLQNAVAAGALPKELEKYNSLDDFVNSERVIQNFQYDQTDIDGAILSGHEVMVRGPYYAIRADKFENYFKQYLELTASGPIATSPRVAKKKDSDVTQALGDKSDGFENGEFVKHRYEPIIGEIVNAFHTNGFVQIKNYNGDLLLAKKSNLTIIKPDDIEKYKPGDKVVFNSKGTQFDYMDKRRAKVVSTDGITLTVSYGSYGDTIDIPVFFVKRAKLYDTEHPEKGNSVKITSGEYAGEYGIINYVGFGNDIEVDFGEGESGSVSNGKYEVVDPNTVPLETTASKFQSDEYVEIDHDGGMASGLVGTIQNPGKLTSTVRIFGNTNVYPVQKVKNNRLSTISKEDFEKRQLYNNAEVVVVSGKDRGKTGKISYFHPKGNIEIVTPDAYYVDTHATNVVLKDKYSGKLNTDPDFKKTSSGKPKLGDTVLIKDGPKSGKTGKVTYVYSTGKSVEVGIDDDSYTFQINNVEVVPDKSAVNAGVADDDDLIDLVDLDFEPLDEPTPPKSQTKTDTPTFNVGDTVKVTSGEHKGKIGEVNYIYSSNDDAYVKIDDNFYDIPSKNLEISKKEEAPAFDIDALNFMVGDEANATNPDAVKKQWEVIEIQPDYVVLKNKITQSTYKSPMEKFYKANPEYAPTNNSLFQEGDEVIITSGNFKDFEGTVVSNDDASSFDNWGDDYKAKPGDVKVKINIFDKYSIVPVPPKDLKKIEGSATSEFPSSMTTSSDAASILEKAKKAGKITYGQIDKMFDGEPTATGVEDLFNMLEKLKIAVVADEDMIDSSETPEEKKQRIIEPSNKAELLELLKDINVKPLMRNAVNTKTLSHLDQLYLVMAADEKYYSLLLPYLELKGVKIEKQDA